MPEYLRALLVILVLAAVTFTLAKRPASEISNPEVFSRRKNIWFAMCIAAFIANNFWIFVVFAIFILIYGLRNERNSLALYFLILFVIPVAPVEVPGMGIINYFFDLTYARLLALVILLPAFFSLRKQGKISFTSADMVLSAYLILTAALYLREGSFTNSMRQAFYLFIDIYLPYIVISRSLSNLPAYRDTLLSFVLAILIIAPMAFFEFSKSWLLYSALSSSLELEGRLTGYLGRDGMLRALVTTGQPIALGYLMVVGIGIYFFIQHSIRQKLIRRLGLAVLIVGLISPLSRGPWVGSVALLVAFFATGQNAMRRLMGLALAGVIILPLLSILPGGERVINLLPFIGKTEKFNVDYRERLIDNSLIVIDRNLWFGSTNYLETPEMEEMRQGENIIDIVNSYIQVALETGIIGLSLFVLFFILVLMGIHKALKSIPDKKSEEYLLGRALLATQIAVMVIIFTVSSITIIPIVYWSVAALGVAYARMIRNQSVNTSSTHGKPAPSRNSSPP